MNSGHVEANDAPAQFQTAPGRPGPTTRALWALADQAVVSGGNVLTAIIVGRALGVHALGIYTLLFTAVILANSIVDATLSSSFMIRHPELRDTERRGYSGANFILGASLIVLLGLGTWAGITMTASAQAQEVAGCGLLLAPAVVAYLLREQVRRFEFINFRTEHALRLDILAYGVQILAVVPLFHVFGFDLSTVLLGITLGHGVASVAMLILRRQEFQSRTLPFHRVLADVFHLSRWVLTAHVLLMVSLQMMPWLVTHQLGAAAAGTYAAAMTLSNLANPMLTGFINSMMPAGAAAYQIGPGAVRQALVHDVVLLSASTAIVCLITAIFARDFLLLLFGSAYAGSAPLVQILAAGFFVRSLDVGPYVGCWAMRRPDQNVVGNLVAIFLGASLALALMPAYGVLGAGIGLLLASLATTGLRWWNFLRLARHNSWIGKSHPTLLPSAAQVAKNSP